MGRLVDSVVLDCVEAGDGCDCCDCVVLTSLEEVAELKATLLSVVSARRAAGVVGVSFGVGSCGCWFMAVTSEDPRVERSLLAMVSAGMLKT